MGIFYHMHSVALIEDLPLEHEYKNPQQFYTDADKAYGQVMFSDFINGKATTKSIFYSWTKSY